MNHVRHASQKVQWPMLKFVRSCAQACIELHTPELSQYPVHLPVP